MGIATIIVDQAKEEGWMKKRMYLLWTLRFSSFKKLRFEDQTVPFPYYF